MGQRDLFPQTHRLVVNQTGFEPTDWESRLRASADVTDVERGFYAGYPIPDQGDSATPGAAYYCDGVVGPALAGTPATLNTGQASTFARVTFTSPLDSYDAALSAVVDLGLTLDDYCYYHASHPAWHPMD